MSDSVHTVAPAPDYQRGDVGQMSHFYETCIHRINATLPPRPDADPSRLLSRRFAVMVLDVDMHDMYNTLAVLLEKPDAPCARPVLFVLMMYVLYEIRKRDSQKWFAAVTKALAIEYTLEDEAEHQEWVIEMVRVSEAIEGHIEAFMQFGWHDMASRWEPLNRSIGEVLRSDSLTGIK